MTTTAHLGPATQRGLDLLEEPERERICIELTYGSGERRALCEMFFSVFFQLPVEARNSWVLDLLLDLGPAH